MGPRAQARRRRILDAAARLIVRQGIEHSTVEDLIAEADIARATFYRAFPSLDAVVEALYAEYEQQVLVRLADDLKNVQQVDEAGLTLIIDSVLREQEHRGPLVRAMFREELRPGRGKLWQRRRVAAQVSLVRRWWEDTSGLEADDDLILCLLLLLQSIGLTTMSSKRRRRMRKSLVFVFQAVVAAYQDAHE